MDDIDLGLALALQRDGRASFHTLGASVGLSRAATGARVYRLLATGALRITGVVHPFVLGHRELAHVSIDVRGPVAPVARAVADMPASPFVSVVTGRYALVAEIRVADRAALTRTIRAIRSIRTVAGVDTLSYVEVIRDVIGPTGTPTVTPDAIDVALLQLLQHDGRRSFAALSTAISMSPGAARSRVRRLIDGGVIRIGALLRRSAQDRQSTLGIGVRVRGDDMSIVEALKSKAAVAFSARTIGRFDIVLTLQGDFPTDLGETIDAIRSMPSVETIETWMHLNVTKETYDSGRPIHANAHSRGRSKQVSDGSWTVPASPVE